ncbi:MAG: response regulator SirA [Candidatus Omnitrophica bacterium CG11_big_fil_rev_8_21_14_0_20_42_13]|uniref:Response regulator SirA n=1 Tax=Candidatus Ghiorseimicrobium undicola TaxID=1974746 RepID=A0A2H0LYZ6_9BACT|nr:MAG: response regulator SirA [Candidatus Omnitrophica bacterium CG11_big_fil_rev_8_21_14_0_20_42_13]
MEIAMKKTVVINNEILGRGNDDLGRQIMGSFLRKLCLENNKPEKIIFYNSGVKLLVKNSGVFDAIELLLKSGVDLIACGTCVNYYELKDKIEPVHISDMVTIISTLMNSDNVITV